MNVGLGWLGAVVGVLGCVGLLALACMNKSDRTTDEGQISNLIPAGIMLVLTFVFWAIGMRFPDLFQDQQIPTGWLVGGISGTIAILLSGRLNWAVQNASRRIRRLASLSILFFGLFSTSVAYLLYSQHPINALIGYAIGAILAAILQGGRFFTSGRWVRAEDWALFSTTIAVATVFSAKHFSETQFGNNWWLTPILIATSILVASYIAIELGFVLGDKSGRSYPISLLISAILIAGLSALYSWKIVLTMQLLSVVLIGLAMGAIIAWLGSTIKERGMNTQTGALSVILVTAFATASFRQWSGFGIGVGLIAAWGMLIPVLCEAGEREQPLGKARYMLRLALALGLAILLFRLFSVQYASELIRVGIYTHYVLIGAMLGLVLPFIIADWVTAPRTIATKVLAVLFTGFFTVVAPLFLYILWQINAVSGLLFGLIAAIAFTMLARRSEGDDIFPVGLIALGAQLVAVQFSGALMEMELTRLTRGYFLAGLLVVVIISVGLSMLLASRIDRAEG